MIYIQKEVNFRDHKERKYIEEDILGDTDFIDVFFGVDRFIMIVFPTNQFDSFFMVIDNDGIKIIIFCGAINNNPDFK